MGLGLKMLLGVVVSDFVVFIGFYRVLLVFFPGFVFLVIFYF